MNSPYLQRKYLEFRALERKEKILVTIKTFIKAFVGSVIVFYAIQFLSRLFN